jgi:L-2-hydroxyglutarate oxidase LhgO
MSFFVAARSDKPDAIWVKDVVMGDVSSFVVVGGGIVGCAIARELTLRFPGSSVTVLEKESRLAAHQTGHNSGVVHAGLYYEPGGLKATLCRRGVGLLKDFCAEKGLPYEECGKLVVALDHDQEHRLAGIFERARANGVPRTRMLGPEGIREIEPNAVGVAALHSPGTAIVDYVTITEALAGDVVDAGGTVVLGCAASSIADSGRGVVISTDRGDFLADRVVVCAGLQSDRIARRGGGARQPSVVPFFGQYSLLEPAYRDVLRGLVYPVPDPRYPFLGVHLTKRIDGETMVGPNAFLSLSREGYHGLGLNPTDLMETLANPGFWRFAGRNLRAAAGEARSVLSQRAFLRQAQRYVPALEDARVTRLPRGIRAQAMDADGRLVDDFRIESSGRITQIRNAPSPGATSSMAIAEYIVGRLPR